MPNSLLVFYFGIGISFALAGLLLIGWRHFVREQPLKIVATVSFYFASYLLLHAVWPVLDRRFFLPLLPFSLFFLVKGILRLPERIRSAAPMALWLLVVWYAARTALGLSQMKTLCPRETFAWIENHTGPEERIASIAPATVFLYTGRQGLQGVDILSATPAEFEQRLAGGKINYLLYLPSRAGAVNLPEASEHLRRWEMSREWLNQHPKRFKLVHENPVEQTLLYQVGSGS
jgi:hypothetical protein